MPTEDLFDPIAFRAELKQALELAAAQFSEADHTPRLFSNASVKRSSVALDTLAEHLSVRLSRRLAELEARIAAAEQRRGLFYRGVFDETMVYREGDVISFRSQAWLLQQKEAAGIRPGNGSTWRLISKADFA